MKSLIALAARIGVEAYAANRQMTDEQKWKLMKAMEDAANGAVDTAARVAAIFNRGGDP